MDAKYLAEIKAREQAATPGPWEEKTNCHPQCNGEPWGWISGASGNITWSGYIGKTNADFIAHARTDIPALLAEVERMTAEIATLKKALTRACEDITKHTCECPASLYGAEMCENCNDDDCDSNRTGRWCGAVGEWNKEKEEIE